MNAVSPTRRLRVLVVDDSRQVVDVLMHLLRLWGHDSTAAYDGPSALEIANTYRPDAVLLDIGLPRLDGYEVARRLRLLEGCEGALLVAVTGLTHEDDRRRSFESGFDHYVTKPFHPTDLERLLAAVPAAP